MSETISLQKGTGENIISIRTHLDLLMLYLYDSRLSAVQYQVCRALVLYQFIQLKTPLDILLYVVLYQYIQLKTPLDILLYCAFSKIKVIQEVSSVQHSTPFFLVCSTSIPTVR